MGDWSDMQTGGGFLGWVHRLVMFITWPFRHWKLVLATLVVVFLALVAYAFYHGIKWNDMYDWYKAKWSVSTAAKVAENMQQAAEKAQEHVSQSIDAMKEKVHEIAPEIVAAQKAKEKKEPIKFVAWNVAKFNKAKYQQQAAKPAEPMRLKAPVFEKQAMPPAEQKPEPQPVQPLLTETAVPLVAEPQLSVVETPEVEVSKVQVPQEPYYEGKLEDYYTIRGDLDLTYLAVPEKLYGKADVMGANDLYLNDTYIYLYGIYTDPYIYDAGVAQVFLEKMLQEKEVHCDIVAYTSQTQAATALCFVDGKLINREMVEADLAENVALK